MKFDSKRRFNTIRKDFLSGDYNIETIEWLVDEIRDMISDLSKEEFSLLIEIPRSVLYSDMEIFSKDYPKWQKEHRRYFLGNVECFKEKFFVDLTKKILNEEYYITDMIKTIDYIKDNFNEMRNVHGRAMEIPLRNVEVTIRDARLINEKNLMANGDLFADIISKAIELN